MTVRIHWRGIHWCGIHWCTPQRSKSAFVWTERLFLLAGLLLLGYAMAVYLNAMLYQRIESKTFEDAGPVAVGELLRPARYTLPTLLPVRLGSPVSRMEIPRLGLSVIVVEGVRSQDLRVAAGHIPGTALPGERGNIGIAAHRDTFFRKLSEIRSADRIAMTTLTGTEHYSVDSIKIVAPTDVEVLNPSEQPVLTLVTCYPFNYIGSAPKRFIVRAREEVAR
jgi:sortase A